MRITVDGTHEELRQILEKLLAADIDITAREVARCHSVLKHPSAFTRNAKRRELLEQAQHTQSSARAVRTTPFSQKAATLAEQLAMKSARVVELERQVSGLVASHAACVRAVMQHGGMRSLHRFWRDYGAIAEELRSAGAIPDGAEVRTLARRSEIPPTDIVR
jgi:hypothetical protein